MTDDRIATLYRKPCPSCAHDLPRDAQHCEFCGYTEKVEEENQEHLYIEYLTARLRQVQATIVEIVEQSRQSVLDAVHERRLRDARTEAQDLELELAAYETLSAPAPAAAGELSIEDIEAVIAAQEMPRAEPVVVPEKPVEAKIRKVPVTDRGPRPAASAPREAAHTPHQAMRAPRQTPHTSVRADPPSVRVDPPSVQPPAQKPARMPSVAGSGIPSVSATPQGGRHLADRIRMMEGARICPGCGRMASSAVDRCVCGATLTAAPAPKEVVCPHCTAVVSPGQARCSCGYPMDSAPQLPSLTNEVASIVTTKDRR